MTTSKNSPLTYSQSGVDIDKGNALVEKIKPLAKSTMRSGVMGSIGGYENPVLVSATDGVGTKLKLAVETGIHDTIGIDLVAMCVNDIIVQGAEPLFFLDYFATSALDTQIAEQVISGIATGCKQAGCALLGGETAEMPGLYQPHDYDLAGFAVGAAERGHMLPGRDITGGDMVLGLASSGLHSNGYSLLRKVVERSGLSYSSPAPFATTSGNLGEALLTPTRIYVKPCLAAIQTGGVKALAHITGGGLSENVPRILPDDMAVTLHKDSWQRPPLFDWLQEAGNIEETEMLRTFNCGIGMVLICDPADASAIKTLLENAGETVFSLGSVTARNNGEAVIYA